MAGRLRSRRRLAVVAALVALAVLAPSAVATTAGTGDGTTTSAATQTVEVAGYVPRLDMREVRRIARSSPELTEWRKEHPVQGTEATADPDDRSWTVDYFDENDDVTAQVIVDDPSGTIRETRTGPQVAWQMARGYEGAFGRSITKPYIWIPLFVLFLAPLIRWRRPFSLHTLDLLMLAGFGISLVWFNRGQIFTSVPLAYPPLVYLFARLLWVGFARRRPPTEADGRSVANEPLGRRPRLEGSFPTWLLVAIMLFTLGLRLGLNIFDSNVIDVGYAGVIGADRIADGQTPYGTFPSDCGQCDTYGPLNYVTYVPFEAIMPWTGRWNDLPAAHGAAITFDLLTVIALTLLGWRLGGRRLAAGLGLAWAAHPFTAYTLESNANDSLVAAALAWGLLVAHRPVGRGIAIGLAIWAKFVPVILVLLWLRHPFPGASGRKRRWLATVGGIGIATALSVWPILLDGMDGVRRFWSRTMEYQLDRESPFSIWGQYPELRPVQLGLQAVVVVVAIAVIARPRRLDLRRFAALSGALIVGVQLTMPHWFYLYIPWFLPFALVALVPIWPQRAPSPTPPPPEPVFRAALAGGTEHPT